MIEAKQIKELIQNSTSKLFKASCDDNLDRIIRLKLKGDNSVWDFSSKRLFSSYLAGKLANEFGINSPSVTLVKVNIDKELYMALKAEKEWFDKDCDIGVASEHIELTNRSKTFKDNNEFIFLLKSKKDYIEQIYGMKVFLHWIYLEDYGKNENLQFNQQNKLYFLDFDMAFKNSSSQDIWSNLQDYNWIKIQPDHPKYFEGFTDDIKPFEKWLEKLLKLDYARIDSNIGQLPDCWNLPMNYRKNILDFLFSNRENFVTKFKSAIEKKMRWRERINKVTP